MQNTITIQSAAYPALSFSVNGAGECVGSYWQTDKESRLRVSERAAITEQEAALYFDTQGVLDLSKWLAIHQELKAACEAHCEAMTALAGRRAAELGPQPEPLHYALSPYVRGSDAYRLTPNPNFKWGLFPADIINAYEAWESGAGLSGVFSKPFKKSDGRPCPFPELEAAYAYEKSSADFDLAHDIEGLDKAGGALFNLIYAARQAVSYSPAKTLADLAAKAAIVADYCDPVEGLGGDERPVLENLACDIARLAKAPRSKEAA